MAARTRQAAPNAAFGNAYRRIYVLSQHPAVHDHQTGRRTTRVREVLDGNLEDLMN